MATSHTSGPSTNPARLPVGPSRYSTFPSLSPRFERASDAAPGGERARGAVGRLERPSTLQLARDSDWTSAGPPDLSPHPRRRFASQHLADVVGSRLVLQWKRAGVVAIVRFTVSRFYQRRGARSEGFEPPTF